jgi:hypothetical protein
MKSSSFAKAVALGCLVFVALPVACGDDTSNPNPTPSAGAGAGGEFVEEGGTGGVVGAGGAGGAVPLPPGLSETPSTVECSTSCESAKVGAGAQVVYVDPCCAGPDMDTCGLTTTFLGLAGAIFKETCQAKNQPGDVDAACPTPPAAAIPFMGATATLDEFPGCCRADTGTCGVAVNKVSIGGGLVPLGDLQMGCIDSAPFFDGTPGKACGAGGGGGAGGAAGAGGASLGGASAGGAGGAP